MSVFESMMNGFDAIARDDGISVLILTSCTALYVFYHSFVCVLVHVLVCVNFLSARLGMSLTI